ncbi:MAG: 16S rRNA (cytosine(1402)-N(4))-methyltransferase RsmH [Desulfovibrionaceae bacterium]
MPQACDIHTTVLRDEVVGWLQPKPGGRYIDGTLGLGGHTEAILRADPRCTVLGLDRDPEALAHAAERLAPFGDRAVLRHSAFSTFEAVLDELGWAEVDGAVLDLGVSSLQLDRRERGFSFLGDGPLDMRMDPEGGLPPASRVVNHAGAEELKRIIRDYGDEPLAGKIARAIVKRREQVPFETTAQLAETVNLAYPPQRRRQARNHPATRTFMALRIAVNHEVDELETFLARIPERLAPGARLAIISFHSLEDRMVKRAFREWAKDCICPPRQMQCTCRGRALARVLTKKPQLPGEAEQAANPRSRSAKLRVAERLGATAGLDDGGEAA